MELKANILRIERLSLSDGKGMRTVVFFKGCPLRCAWCSTPESQSGQREVYHMKERCTGCGACIQVCLSGTGTSPERKNGRDREGSQPL